MAVSDTLVPTLPGAAWRVLAADALSAVGTGLTLPFLLVFLHSVHGLGLGLAGAVAATVGAASLVGNPLGGWIADRFGPRRALVAGLGTAGLGAVGWASVATPAHAFAAAAISGLGVSVSWSAQSALLARLVSADQRSSVFAVGNATLNAGMAIGGLTAAVIVDTTRPGTFVALYLIDAASFAVALGLVSRVQITTAVPHEADAGSGIVDRALGKRQGYGRIVRDSAFAKVWLLTAFFALAGFAQFNTALPVLATQYAGLAAGDVGVMFAANMVAVVTFQLVVLRALAGRRRTSGAAIVGALWAGCWALVLVGVLLDGRAVVLATFITAAVVFAVGETLLWPTLPAIVNDIAPEALRGRYNGAFTLALTTGIVLGPLISGLVLDHDLAAPFLAALITMCAGAAFSVRRLAKTIPPHANIVAESSAPDAEHATAPAAEPGP